MGEPKKLSDFLAVMSQDPGMQQAYKDDAEAVMEEHGLADADRHVLRTGDQNAITSHLGDDAPPGCLVFPFII